MRHFTLGLDDIYAFLGDMPKSSKDAICYSLFTNTTIQQSIDLRWSDEVLDVPYRALKILEGVKIRSDCDYVFNEHGARIETLTFRFHMYTGFVGWEKFRRVYKDAVAIDFSLFFEDKTITKNSLR